MPKKKEKSGNALAPILESLPWSCTHFGGQSEIETYIPALEKWVTLAEVYSVGGIDAEDLADFIVRTVNESKNMAAIAGEIAKGKSTNKI